MSEISKEALTTACAEKVKQLEFSVKQSAFDSVRHELETELAIARVALLALRERAEPDQHEAHIRREVNVGGNTWVQCSAQAFEREKARGALCRVLYESPPAPVVPEDVLAALRKVANIRLDFNDFDGDRRGMADCLGEAEEDLIEVVNRRAAMLAAPGKN
ncbi:hypothetical protein ACVR2H_000191 [Cronobacter sakazakii]